MSNYLYNGVELPELPTWDKSTYPVAVISTVLDAASSMYAGAKYILTLGKTFLWLNGKCYVSAITGVYRYDGSAWVWHYGSGTTYNQDIIVEGFFEALWSRTDIPTADGGVYLAGSEPEAVGGGGNEGEGGDGTGGDGGDGGDGSEGDGEDDGGGNDGDEEGGSGSGSQDESINTARRKGFISGFVTGLSVRGVFDKKTITEDAEAQAIASAEVVGASFSLYNPETVRRHSFILGFIAGTNVKGILAKKKITEPETAYPVMAASNTWYKGTTERNTITEINFVKSYTASGSETESWAADVDGTGSIMCYVNGTVLTISSQGAEKIMANENASYMFSFEWTFQGFTSVTAINDLEMLDTHNATTMLGMFAQCNALTSLDLSSFNTSKVTDMSQMFYGCGFTSIDLSQFDTSQVTNFKDMFAQCNALTSLDLSSFNTSNVTNMSGMFDSCRCLVDIDLSSFNTSNVTSMGQMFQYCNALTSLDLSSFDTSNVTSMGSMFSRCYALTSLDLSNFDTSSVMYMTNLFLRCEALASLDISNFDTSKATDMHGMFSGCKVLTSLDLRSFDTSNVTVMTDMFYYCAALTVIYVGSGWKTANADTTDMFDGCGVSSVTYV